MPRLKWRTVRGALAGLLLLGFAGCETSPDGGEWITSPRAQQQVAQVTSALDNGLQKVCSGVVGNQFRDSIVVPANWTGTLCQSWATSIGTTQFQLGCLNTPFSGYFWCTAGATSCAPCGWTP